MFGIDNQKCTVGGVLVLVLRMSRALGGAPLGLAHVNEGYIATISQFAAVYGYIFTLCRHIGFISSHFVFIIFPQEKDIIYPFGDVYINFITIVITGIGSYRSVSRMRGIIYYLNLLEKIHFDVNGNIKIKDNKKLSQIIYFYIFIWISLLVLTKYLTFQVNYPITEFMHSLIYIEYLNVVLLQMESNLIHYDVHCVCVEINIKIRKLIDETQGLENVSLAKLRSTSKNVQDLSKAYVSICDFVKRLNEDRGVLLYALFSSTALSVIFAMCNLTEAFFLPGGIRQTVYICIQLVWACLHLFGAAFFIQPCHLTRVEISKMQSLLSQLMYNVTSVGKSIPLQLDLMFKQFFLNKLTFSPLEMLTFERSLLATMIGFITTYVVILVQYVEKRWTK